MIHKQESVNPYFDHTMQWRKSMHDRKVTPGMVPVIKLARSRKINYSVIASYFVINQGRIADVMKGRLFPEVPPAQELPTDFPSA